MQALSEKLLPAVVPLLGYAYIRLLRATMRIEYRNRDVLERVRAEGRRYILAFWHSRWVMMPFGYPDRRLVVLISEHRDAQMLGRILRRLGIEVAVGSSTRGGARGARHVLRRVAGGHDVAIAPDGPRGPRRCAKPGVVAIARLAGVPIVPVAFSARPARRLRSWDGTLIPRPFGRGLFVYGEPIDVPRAAGADECERLRERLERDIDALTDRADDEAGLPLEPPRALEAAP